MAAVVDNRTPNYDIPLPNAGNWLSEDVIRLAQAITAFDQLIKTANDNVAGRALIEHAHQISEITGLTDALAQKAAYDHVHALAALSDVDVSIITVGQYLRWNGSKWVPGVVSADDIKAGMIDPARLPSIAITDTYVVSSQAQMLALDVQKGDIAVRTDLNRSYICSGTNPALLASWTELLTPTDAVLSVAGLTGAITASALRTAIATTTGIALMTAASAAAARAAIDAAATNHNQDWGTITGKPGSYPPSAHNQDWSTITGKPGLVEKTSGNFIGLGWGGSGLVARVDTSDIQVMTSNLMGPYVTGCRYVSYTEQGIGGTGWHGGGVGGGAALIAVHVSGSPSPGVWGIGNVRYATAQFLNNGQWWNFS